MEQTPLGEANCFVANQENPLFYGTRKFITAACLCPGLHKPSPGFPFPILEYHF